MPMSIMPEALLSNSEWIFGNYIDFVLLLITIMYDFLLLLILSLILIFKKLYLCTDF